MPRGSFNDTHKTPEANGVSWQDNPVATVQGTAEQMAVWDALLNGTQHVIVEAVAGSGKTFTIVEYAKQERPDVQVGLVAFNKHIADELRNKIGARPNVQAMTYHSLGFRAVREHVGKQRCEVDKYKVFGILDDMSIPVPKRDVKQVKYRVASMVGYAKSYGLKPDVDRDMLEYLADRFDVDMEGRAEIVYDLVPKVLQRCMDELGTVDYDDQVWLPMALNLPVPRYDVLCVDEYQDTGLTQQWLAIKSARRLCAVGDPHQAIYAFRGADSKGFDRLRETLGNQVITLPLTLTRRCPKQHVTFAQHIVPQIVALDDAPAGVVRVSPDLDAATNEMKPGDLVVCRVNAELVGTAYKLLKRGVRALIRGRDLGEGLRRLVEDAEADAVQDLGSRNIRDIIACAGKITQQQVSKFNAMPNDRGVMRAHNAQDRYDCMCTLAGQVKSVNELKDTIAKLFDDADSNSKTQVTLGTVHRTKGLEGNRVFILRPDLIPHPMARKAQDKESERNLGYVAVTRAKFDDEHELPGELIFVGVMSPMFQSIADELGIENPKPKTDDDSWGNGDTNGDPEIEVDLDVDQHLDEFETLMEEIAHDKAVDDKLDGDKDDGIPEHRRWKN